MLRQCHAIGVGDRDAQAEWPDDHDERRAGREFHARLERVHDDEVAIDGDGSQREGRDEDADHLSVRDKVTQDGTEDPSAWEQKKDLLLEDNVSGSVVV